MKHYNVKTLNHSAKTSNIVLGKQTAIFGGGRHRATADAKNQIDAIYALMGGYNEVGRNVDVNRYTALKNQFDSAVEEMAAELAQAN